MAKKGPKSKSPATGIRWSAITGPFKFSGADVEYLGGMTKYGENEGEAIGQAMCDVWFNGGSIRAVVNFSSATERSACDLLFFYNPSNRAFIGAGLSNEVLYGIKSFEGRWTPFAAVGEAMRLEPKRDYELECRVRGSVVVLLVDGVEVAHVTLPVALPKSQVGVWCRGKSPISIRGFQVDTVIPTAFVVMQFSTPYNELFSEVIEPICTEMGIQAFRADQTYRPGLVIADVARQINEAKVVIAEISPTNPNVYYEVGYAHASQKPTILIADRAIEKLPFDVSGFRTLFYENTIDGKHRVEDGLRNSLKAILDPSQLTGNLSTTGRT